MNSRTMMTILIAIILFGLMRLNSKLAVVVIAAAAIYLIFKALPTFYLIKANRKYFNNEVEEALSLYEKASKVKQSAPSITITYAYILLKESRTEKAEEVLREVMEKHLNPKDKTDAIMNLALVLWKSNRIQEAIDMLEDLYDDGFKTTLLYQTLGFFYVLSGDLQKALEFNKEAYDYSNTDTSILDNLALNYYFIGNYDEALELYEKLIPMNPTFVTAYYYYGLTLKHKERYTDSLEALKRAHECKFSFLSTIKKEQVENEIKEIESLLS